MANPDQISAFEKQVESSLDQQIKELFESDQKKAETIKYLKQEISAQIKQERADDLSTPEKEGKYSEDLCLSDKELEEIYKAIEKTQGKLLKENEILSFDEFMSFIGVGGKREVKFAKSLQDVKIFGKKINLALPLGASEIVIKNYQQALDQVRERKKLAPYFTEGMDFMPLGGARLEFMIKKEDGKEIKYAAFPEEVLRVDEEESASEKKTLIKIQLQRRRMEKNLREKAKKDSLLNEEQRMMIEHGDEKGMDMEMHFKRGKEEGRKNVKIPEDYQNILNQIKSLKEQEKDLQKKCDVKMLYDEQTGTKIRERGDSFYLNNFTREYLDEQGRVKKDIYYVSDIKSNEEEYEADTGEKRKGIQYYDSVEE